MENKYIIIKDYFNDDKAVAKDETFIYCFTSSKTAEECKKLLIDTVLRNKNKENKGFIVPFEGIFIDPYHFRRLTFNIQTIESYHKELQKFLSNEIKYK